MKIKEYNNNKKNETYNNHVDNTKNIDMEEEAKQLQYNFMVNSSIQYFLGAMDMWFNINKIPLMDHTIALKKLVEIKKNKAININKLKKSPDPFLKFLAFFTNNK